MAPQKRANGSAEVARTEYNRVLHFLTSATESWQTQAHTASALTGEGIENVWDVVQAFQKNTRESGIFNQRREAQMREWLHSVVENQLVAYFFQHPKVKSALPAIEEAVIKGDLPATAGAQQLLELILLEASNDT